MDNWDNSPPFPVSLDILLAIVAHLPFQSVFTLRRTCKSLCAVTRLRTFWSLLFRIHVLDRQIPYPNLGSTPFADLSAPDLESLTRRALTLRRAWTSPEPVFRRHVTLDCPTCTSPGARVIFLQFLPDRLNRWLISVRMTPRSRIYLLQCWDMNSERPRCVAELKHADGPFGGVVLNSDPTSSAVLAMQSAQTETFSIQFDAEDPECAFQTEATIDGVREVHLLSGSTLVTSSIDEGGVLCLWDLADLRQEKLQLLNPSLVQPDDRVHTIHLAHDYALVVRMQSIEIYATTPRPSLLSVRAPPVAYPLAQFKFQWRTDTVALCEQHTSPLASSCPGPRPIHLLVRFGSIYPWAVNVLHHYLLLPNPTYCTGGRAYARGGSSLSPASTRSQSPTASRPSNHSPTPAPTTEYNLPYDPRPHLVHTISSPIRLFGQCAMTLGRYGTALWLDNNTEEWQGPSECGQRLAGKVVQLGDGASTVGAPAGTGADCGSRAALATATVPVAGAKPAVGASSTDASMVFGVRYDDVWTHIAIEEEAGRIALGHIDGAITLLDF